MKKLIILIGIPGSGKTTLAQKIIEKGFHCLNADKIREELYGDASEQGDKEQVFSIFFERLEIAFQKELNVIVDNTNLNPKQRKPILDKARQFGYQNIQLWLLDMPLDICLKRNSSRERVVPEDIVSNMFLELNKSGRPRRTEGKITIIRPSKEGDDYLFFPQQ